ncbi:MAG: PAS domain-containing protein [Alphaproteobacteria bacterium]|nr:PAS domain-containing protein [Alphaproteobacteria bacterium]
MEGLACKTDGSSELEPIIDLLYEAVTDSTKWEPLLESCAKVFGASSASINILDPTWSSGLFNAFYKLDPGLLVRFMDYVAEDPRLPLWKENPGRPLSDHLELPQAHFDRSRLFTEVMRPNGIEYSLGVHLPQDGVNSGFVFFRSPSDRVFNEREVAKLGKLVPHLRRAVRLFTQFMRLERDKWAAMSVLDTMPLGILVADAEAHLQHANLAAREILGLKDGLLVRHNLLWGSDSDSTSKLKQAIRAAIDGHTPQGITLPRLEGSPLLLRIGSLRQDSFEGCIISLEQPLAILYITDPDRPQETMLELLQRLYGLTPREVELAAALSKGERLDDCSARMKISKPTAKTHLQSIFSKTGAATQADLVRLVLSAPVWEMDATGLTRKRIE